MVQSGKAFSRSIHEIFSGFGDSKFELYTLFPLKVYLNEVDFRYSLYMKEILWHIFNKCATFVKSLVSIIP
jgi:hypothetical protein